MLCLDVRERFKERSTVKNNQLRLKNDVGFAAFIVICVQITAVFRQISLKYHRRSIDVLL